MPRAVGASLLLYDWELVMRKTAVKGGRRMVTWARTDVSCLVAFASPLNENY